MNARREVTPEERDALNEVLRAIRKVKHGNVQVIVQDGRVIQIDTTEKVRLDGPPA